MVIDFDKITEEHIEGFKGGEGKLDTRAYVDNKARIMYSTLRPGARSGEHLHSGTFEVMYVISGRCIIVLKDITIGLKTIPTTMLYILL